MVQIKDPRLEIPSGPCDKDAEERSRIGGPGQPIIAQEAGAALGQSVEKILVLIGIIERRLAVGSRENDGQEQDGRH